MRRKTSLAVLPDAPSDVSYVGLDDSAYYTEIHGRRMNSMNPRYMLPADADEVRVSFGELICEMRTYESNCFFFLPSVQNFITVWFNFFLGE